MIVKGRPLKIHYYRSWRFRELKRHGTAVCTCPPVFIQTEWKVSFDPRKLLTTMVPSALYSPGRPKCLAAIATIIPPMPWLGPLSLCPRRRICSWHLFLSLSVFSCSMLAVYSLSIANSYLYSIFLVKIVGRNSGSQLDAEETLKVE